MVQAFDRLAGGASQIGHAAIGVLRQALKDSDHVLGNAAPLLTVLWGVWLFRESISPAFVVGGTLTLGGNNLFTGGIVDSGGGTVNFSRSAGNVGPTLIGSAVPTWVTLSNGSTFQSTTTGNGGIDDLTGLSGSGRYVRVYGTVRATQYGYSLWDFEVY